MLFVNYALKLTSDCSFRSAQVLANLMVASTDFFTRFMELLKLLSPSDNAWKKSGFKASIHWT